MEKPIGTDADGFTILQTAVKSVLNQYPDLLEGEVIRYGELDEKSGIAFFDDTGALVYNEHEDVCGVMHQVCQYQFLIVYRTSSGKERNKITIQEFLNSLGKWLCREPVTINGRTAFLEQFPELTGGRIIKRITRENPYPTEPTKEGIQDWVLPMAVRYKYDFETL